MRFSTLVILCLASLALLQTNPMLADAPQQPNILIVLVDDMGYGDPGCFNAASKIRTPHIDSLARDGMRFVDAHAPGPLCHLSRYGLVTGRYPFRAPVGSWRTQPVIEKGQATLASLLKQQGYVTAMVGKWHLGFAENGYDRPLPGGPIDVGFDSFFGIRASTDIPPYFYIRGDQAVQPPTRAIEARSSAGWSPIQGAFSRAGKIAPEMELQDVLPRFTAEAIDVIETHRESAQKDKPLLLYLAYPAPHTPWLPSPAFAGQSKVDMYGDFVEMVDAMVGRVLKTLEEQQMHDNTLVIFTSDNGPVWYESDVQRFDHDSAGGWRGMKADAWEAGHRMPLIVRWPGEVARGSISRQTISFTDLAATLATITGAKLGPDDLPDSFDLYRVLTGDHPEHEPIRPSLPLRSGGGHMTLRKGKWKLIQGLGSGGFSQPRKLQPQPGGPVGQLYDLHADPGETQNLYLQHPQIVADLEQELESIVQAEGHRKR